jgi:N-acetylglucosaminyldiphosphoundecaprenol N-acetyl-beta-D-mannosaminyltransferase
MRVFGVRVDEVDMAEALRRLRAPGPGPRLVASVNPEILMRARVDPVYRAALNSAALNIPDGVGVLLVARLLGRPLPARVAGIELAERLLQSGRQRVFLYGGEPGVAEGAAAYLCRRNPELDVVGTWHGFQDEQGDEAVRAAIRASRPDVLLVGLGFPRQELWLARHLGTLPVGVAMPVGGAFDVWSGRKRRAPAFVRRLGLEWAFRLISEPRRLRRMRVLPTFLLLALWEGRAGRARP